MAKKRIRHPVVAGLFYPKDPDALRSMIRTCFEDVSSEYTNNRRIWGAVVPHAGYKYSGPVAAHTYQALKNLSPERIIIVGPSHRQYFQGISVYEGAEWQTPIGSVQVDNSFGRELADKGTFESGELGHTEEHAIEVQLPFLQYIYSHDFAVVPITMGSQSPKMVEQLAEALKEHTRENDVILASSDLSHYYSYSKALVMDNRLGELVEKGDITGLWNALDRHEIEACGFGPVMALMELSRRRSEPNPVVLKYANSGDVTGDRDQVVGYISAIFEKE